jgi:hypothetical protein
MPIPKPKKVSERETREMAGYKDYVAGVVKATDEFKEKVMKMKPKKKR